ncbi:MAG: DNA cytosine methyltransferase [Candidatus Fonsibacter sp.]
MRASTIPFRTRTIMVLMFSSASVSESPLLVVGSSCFHTQKVVPRAPKGIILMALGLRVGTECSGMERVPYASNEIGLRADFQLLFVCEKDRLCRKLIQQCHRKATKPMLVCKDVQMRRSASLREHDLYIAGISCQPFSAMGRGEGLQESQCRGQIIFRIMKAIATKKPRALLHECQMPSVPPPRSIA